MSTSTVSVTAKHTTLRRRHIATGDDKCGLELTGIDASLISAGDSGKSVETSRRKTSVQMKRPVVSDFTIPYLGGAPVKTRPRTVKTVVIKNLLFLLLLAGLVEIIRKLYWSSVVSGVYMDAFDVRIAEVEAFVKKSVNDLQVKVDVLDRKLMDKYAVETGGQLDQLGSKVNDLVDRMESFDKHLSSNNLLLKDEFDKFFEDYKKAKGGIDENGSLDEVMAYAREVVKKEVEKHAADGLGRVDYALASGGAFVTRHSKAYVGEVEKTGFWFSWICRNGMNDNSVKMLRPSFGEPGDCFALEGSVGFVEIKLRKAIVVEAVTLEHVAKGVAYDRSTAPKDCRLYGWLRRQETDILHSDKMFALAEFTYDLEKSNAQTFDASNSSGVGIVDMVRLEFMSNHGSPSHICIYRFRVHGHELASVDS